MINENIHRWTLKEVLDKVAATATREEKAKVLKNVSMCVAILLNDLNSLLKVVQILKIQSAKSCLFVC